MGKLLLGLFVQSMFFAWALMVVGSFGIVAGLVPPFNLGTTILNAGVVGMGFIWRLEVKWVREKEKLLRTKNSSGK